MRASKSGTSVSAGHGAGRRRLATLGAALLLTASFAGSAAGAERILKFAPTVPEGNPTVKFAWQPWIDQVNKEAKGEFQIKVFGMALANSRNVWERTVNGVTDIGLALNVLRFETCRTDLIG